MIEAGIYTATLVSHAITETKEKKPQVVATFSITDKSGTHKISWYGSFSDKARDYTINNLITLGLKGNNPAGELDVGKNVELVIETETDDKGKDRPRVRYINALGAVRGAMSQDLAKQKLKDLEAHVLKARQKMPAPAAIPNHAPNFDSDEKLPF